MADGGEAPPFTQAGRVRVRCLLKEIPGERAGTRVVWVRRAVILAVGGGRLTAIPGGFPWARYCVQSRGIGCDDVGFVTMT